MPSTLVVFLQRETPFIFSKADGHIVAYFSEMTSVPKSRILVASADKKIHQQIVEALEESADVLYADTSEEAQIKILEEYPDVLIYDINSRETMSLACLGVIRKMRPRIPAIVVVSETQQKQAGECLEMGIFYLLTKPISITEMRTIVESALKKQKKDFST